MAYPTLAQVKVYSDVSGSSDDTTITQLLNAAIAAVEEFCNTSFVASAETLNIPLRNPYITQNRTVLTPFKDIASITLLTNGDGNVITSDQYYTEPYIAPYNQIILREYSGIVFTTDGDNTPIELQADIGYSATCPADVFLEIMRITRTSWIARAEGENRPITKGQKVLDSSMWPMNTRETLERYRR